MLSDPKRLRTPSGHGYLVSWKHRLRTESEPFDTNRLELGFTVNASAPDVLEPDGPGRTHGRYLLDLFHQHATMFFGGRHLVVQQIGGRAFPATDGALLRR